MNLSIFLQNYGDPNINTPDVLDTVGRAFYTISFMTPYVFVIDKSALNCGQQTWRPIVQRFNIRNILDEFHHKTLQNSATVHPLENQGDHLQPEILRNKLDQFKFRSKVALSCLFEKGQSKKLERTLNSLISTLQRKINILESILQDKVDMKQHNCVSQIYESVHSSI